MTDFDETKLFTKQAVLVSLTAPQRAEVDQMKEKLHIVTDGALIKTALAELSNRVLGSRY